MFALARQTLRGHLSGFVAAFVAVFCGSVLITLCGILIDSGQRGGIPPQRYASAPVVVTGPQELYLEFGMTHRFVERVPVPVSHLDAVAKVPGVRDAVGDVTVRAERGTAGGAESLEVHGWSSSALGPITLVDGTPPAGPDEVVLSADTGARPGDTAEIRTGGVATSYRVVGVTTAARDQAFLTDEGARTLSGRPDAVDAIAVLSEPDVSADELAERIRAAVPDVEALVGDDRADAEFLDVGTSRSFLMLIAGSFGGTMLMVVLAIVAVTLGLSVQQRRREFALLRAIAATPRQIYALIASETAVLATVAAVLGALPGVGLSFPLRDALAAFGVIPPEFEFVLGPLPVVVSVVACVACAVVAGVIAARRAARISPVSALGEATREPPRLGRGRLVTGWSLVVVGVVTGIALPLTIGGPTATAGAAGSALLVVIGMGLVGPRLLTMTTSLLGRIGFARPAAGWLAYHTARAHSRKLGSATTPLVLGVTMALVQIATITTTTAATERQLETGLVSDHVLIAPGGIAPEVVDAVGRVPNATAVPVAHSQVLVTYDEWGEPTSEAYSAQGVPPSGIEKVMDLDVRSGDLAGLADDGVAVSEFAARTFGVDVGESLTMRLGDGTPHTATVVAVYGNGLGFGDVTLPNDVLVEHTTSGLNTYVLVRGAAPDALRAVLADHPGVEVTDRNSFVAGRETDENGENAVALLLNLALLAFVSIAVVNVLVLATAARAREFALLRLVGAGTRQVSAMMHGEAAIVVLTSVVFGTLAAVPPLVGISLSLTGDALPSVPPLAYLGVVAVAVVLGWCSIALPTRFALREKPVEAMGVGE